MKSPTRPALVDLDADEIEINPRRAITFGFVVVRLDRLGPTPVDAAAVARLRAAIAKRAAARASGRAKKARP